MRKRQGKLRQLKTPGADGVNSEWLRMYTSVELAADGQGLGRLEENKRGRDQIVSNIKSL
jgi:hypothetical protein